MNEDGRIDYSRYSREDLLQVLDHIDGEKFPLNLERAREELARRPLMPLPLPAPALTKRERTAAALKLDICWTLIVEYTVLIFVLSFVFELMARWATLSEVLQGPWSLLPVLSTSVLLAKRSPSGFYINASVIVFINVAFWTLLAQGGSQPSVGLATVSWLFWSLCTVSVAGLLCGLWPVGENRTEDA